MKIEPSTRRSSASQSKGFSMIEILVAILVLSVGLLGMAALMATSMRNAHSANQRTQATNLAYEIVDSIRADLSNAMWYHNTAYSDPAVACTTTNRTAYNYVATTPPHTHDVARWARDLCFTLPNGQGRVMVTEGTAQVAASGESYRTYQVVVQICWFDDRAATGTADCNNATAGPDTVIQVTSSL